MRPEVEDRLYDIIEAGESVQELIAGMSFNDYAQARVIRLAVERQMITVGEALSVALQLDPTLRNRITEARDIADFRNCWCTDIRSFAMIVCVAPSSTTSPSSSPRSAPSSRPRRSELVRISHSVRASA